jgi:amino acid adenylation domain-containing protein
MLTVNDSVQALIAPWVERLPDVCAVRESRTRAELTYRDLWERSGWLASLLQESGIGRGDVVAVNQDRGAGLTVTLLGILRAGAAYLPLDGHAPAARVSAILAEAKARLVVSSADVGDRREPRDTAVGGNDPAYVAYTSGSSGRPKGVVVPHRAVVRLAVAPTFCTVREGDRVANMSNTAFDATTFEIWNTLTAGGTIVVLPTVADLAIDDWVERVRAERVDTMFLTTSLFHAVARERPDAFGSLDCLVVGGEQLDLAAVRDVLGAAPPGRLVNGYGPTETTTFAASHDCTEAGLAGHDRVPIGLPLQRTALYVLDADLEPVSPGEAGELCVGGPAVALGYIAQPGLTAARFVPDPAATGATMYRTGDVVRQLPDGALQLLGRSDRQVKLRGFRIELDEIERVAAASALVDAAFVEKVGDGPSALLAGFVLPAREATVARHELPGRLSRELARLLPEYMVPARWLVLAELPLGPTGKVDRRGLLALLETDASATAERDDDEAADATLAAVRGIWRDVLRVPRVLATDNFIECGGNSILAVQVASRVHQRLAVPLEPADVLLADSFAELVCHVREAAKS